jgi:hypothetical protein
MLVNQSLIEICYTFMGQSAYHYEKIIIPVYMSYSISLYLKNYQWFTQKIG